MNEIEQDFDKLVAAQSIILKSELRKYGAALADHSRIRTMLEQRRSNFIPASDAALWVDYFGFSEVADDPENLKATARFDGDMLLYDQMAEMGYPEPNASAYPVEVIWFAAKKAGNLKLMELMREVELKRKGHGIDFCQACIDDSTPSPSSSGAPDVAITEAVPIGGMHTIKRNTHPLDGVINKARNLAIAKDWLTVWNTLCEMAEFPSRPAPLLGYSPGDGVKYRHECDEGFEFFNKEAFRGYCRREEKKRKNSQGR